MGRKREKNYIDQMGQIEKKNCTVGLNTNILNANRPGSPNKCSRLPVWITSVLGNTIWKARV